METVAIREAFVRLWSSLGTFWGVPPTTAGVFGWLLSRSKPAEAQEIMEGLELSRGAVSMACRELRAWGLVTAQRVPGSRRILYAPVDDLEKIVRNVVQIRKQREWDPILESLRQWIPALEADPAPENAVFAERLRAMEALVELADSIVERFLKGGTVSNLGLKLLLGTSRGRGERSEKAREKARAASRAAAAADT
jgi:DNA-binding transcriptional regulator GbsR (MarR family)